MPPNTFSDFQSLTIVAYLRSMAAATATTHPAVIRRAAKPSMKERADAPVAIASAAWARVPVRT